MAEHFPNLVSKSDIACKVSLFSFPLQSSTYVSLNSDFSFIYCETIASLENKPGVLSQTSFFLNNAMYFFPVFLWGYFFYMTITYDKLFLPYHISEFSIV